MGMVFWIIYIVINKDQWARSILPLSWTIHVAIFAFACILLDPTHSNPNSELWCAIVKVHGIIVVAGEGAFKVIRQLVLLRIAKEIGEVNEWH